VRIPDSTFLFWLLNPGVGGGRWEVEERERARFEGGLGDVGKTLHFPAIEVCKRAKVEEREKLRKEDRWREAKGPGEGEVCQGVI
jgi:hypothetical protein